MTEEEKKEKKEKRRTADYLWYLHVTGEWVLLLFAACNGFRREVKNRQICPRSGRLQFLTVREKNEFKGLHIKFLYIH
jgi:hypothetical protein